MGPRNGDDECTLSRLTASSYAARRLGPTCFILGHLCKLMTTVFSPASRVSISELLARPCACDFNSCAQTHAHRR
jgi:hypothetical protein